MRPPNEVVSLFMRVMELFDELFSRPQIRCFASYASFENDECKLCKNEWFHPLPAMVELLKQADEWLFEPLIAELKTRGRYFLWHLDGEFEKFITSYYNLYHMRDPNSREGWAYGREQWREFKFWSRRCASKFDRFVACRDKLY